MTDADPVGSAGVGRRVDGERRSHRRRRAVGGSGHGWVDKVDFLFLNFFYSLSFSDFFFLVQNSSFLFIFSAETPMHVV